MQQSPTDTFPESYAAFFAPRTHKFATLDFRTAPSPHNLRHYFPSTTSSRRVVARHAGVLALLVGLLVAILGFVVDQLTRGLTIGLYRLTATLFSTSFALALFVHLLLALFYVLLCASFVVFVAPLGAGSGIPELKAFLNGVRIPSFLSLPTLLVKAFGVAFSIASGLICGKQGPMIHAGAIIAAAVSHFSSTTFRFRLHLSYLRPFRTNAWKRDFTAVGAAAGVAVAFGSPMGAWMWVYEEACTHWTWQLGIITLIACLSGAAVARILNYLASALPGGGFGTFTLTQVGKLVTPFGGTSFPIKDLPAFVLIAVLGGVFGAVLPFINKHITLFRYRFITKPIPRLFETALIATLTVLVRLLVPYVADDCRPSDPEFVDVLSNAPSEDFSQFNCPDGFFSPWAAALYNPTDSVVRGLLFQSDSVFFSGPLFVALAFYFVFMVWTYGIAVPAGIFFPGFLLGSVYGRLVGVGVQAIFPSRTDVSLTGYAFVGAVSALAGITRTISVAVIALEATGSESASYATVLVALVAKLVGDFLYSRGIYDLHIDLKGIPFLSYVPPFLEQYSRVRVSAVMESSVIGVRRRSAVSSLLNMLRSNKHHAFPVFARVSTPPPPQVLNRDETAITENTDATNAALSAEESQDTGADNESSMRSSIIMPTVLGMEATIFDDGRRRVMWFPNHSEQWLEPQTSSGDGTKTSSVTNSSGAAMDESKGSDQDRVEVAQALDYQLMGMVDRATLLVLLKHECDKREFFGKGEAELQTVSREELDTAWPNAARLKGDEEAKLIQRVKNVGILDVMIDLTDFTDPDPVLISDRAPSATAYRTMRSTGARHILVANMRSGRICGIVTRKDILPESIAEVLEENGQLSSMKVD